MAFPRPRQESHGVTSITSAKDRRGPLTKRNLDTKTVHGFGVEWSHFDQSALEPEEFEALFHKYFAIFDFSAVGPGAEGFDAGCGSGRWARGVAPRVGILHCVDASKEALNV